MIKITTILFLIALCVIPSIMSQIYDVNMACGTCQKLTGCPNNMCIIFTGDIQNEYCYGNETCSIISNQTLSLSPCLNDFSGSICQSGICATGASMNMCYGTGQQSQCLDGVNFDQTCSNGTITMSLTGGQFGNNTSNSTIPLNLTCPFTRAYGNYSTCSGDGMGTSCNCCYSLVIEGLSALMGSCVPADSPISQAKTSMTTTGKYGFQTLFSVVLILLQLLFISI